MTKAKTWYDVKAKADGESADVYIYDEIGFCGIPASNFVRAIQGLKGKHLNVYVNSPGGDVDDGMAIYNVLRRHEGGVDMVVDGLAASMASVIVQAGDTRKLNRGATMMVHEPWGIAIGDTEAMDKMSSLLDLVGDQIAGIYADRAGGTAEDWRAVMAEETWYDAAAAIAAGLADAPSEDAVKGELTSGRVFNLSKFNKVPDWVGQADGGGEPGDPVQDDPKEGQEEDGMDLTAIRQALGLDEDGDILAAITELKGQVTSLQATIASEAPNKGELAQLRAELSAANQQIIALDLEKDSEMLTLRQRVHTMEATHRVDQAIAQGRVTPANREIALKVAMGQTEEEFNAFIRQLPRVDLTERGSAGNYEDSQYEPTQADIEVARAMGSWDDADPAGSRLRLMKAKGLRVPAAKSE